MDRQEITPFRLQVLMDVASKCVKSMNSGVWHLTLEEMELVVEHIKIGIEKSKECNTRGGI